MNKQKFETYFINHYAVSGRWFVKFVEIGVLKTGLKFDLTLLELLKTIGDNSGGCPYLSNLSIRFLFTEDATGVSTSFGVFATIK